MLVIAHRGASGHEPENTLLAIKQAIKMDVDGIEIDVHEIDKQLVVIHDRWLHRTTNGQGQLKNHSFAHIRTLDAGKGEKIPTLAEVLAVIAGQCFVNIELKGVSDLSLLYKNLADAQRLYHFSNQQLLISSFNHHLLQQISHQHPQYPIGALTACYPLNYAQFAEELNAYSVHLDVDFISEKFVFDAHQRNIKVFVYTVDEIDDINTMKALGVDGIFSNYPSKAKSYLAHKRDCKNSPTG